VTKSEAVLLAIAAAVIVLFIVWVLWTPDWT